MSMTDNIIEYIWHCPSKTCHKKGTVLFKTNNPMLNSVKIRCHKCNEEFYYFEIMAKNKKNLKKYMDSF